MAIESRSTRSGRPCGEYGDADWIGPEHGGWYAEQIDGAQLSVVAGAGHLLPLVSWPEILQGSD